MKKYIYPTIAVLTLVLGFFVGNAVSNRAQAQKMIINNGQVFLEPTKLDQLLLLIQKGYVEPIDTDSLTEEVMTEVVQKLDPHSAYIPKKDLEMVNSELAASFSGIGVQFHIENDTVHVVSVVSGGPSEGVGLLAGDKIIEVDDSVFVGKKITNEKVMHTLRGEKGTQVKIGILRSGTDETLHFTITRGDIPTHSVNAKFIIPIANNQKTGFVRVDKFGEDTYQEFLSALSYLRAQGATSYIVDLRENSGGFMGEAINMANEFLDNNDLIVYAEGRAYPRMESRATGTGRFKKEQLVVLIDNFSASASEIFSGAMQDNDRATIIGRRSFGKGLVQQQIPFTDGSALRLTVARYYIPSGRCIQKPYTRGEQDNYQMELFERFNHGELFSADSIHFTDTTKYYTKKGRIVHGGGGIMPDIFVGRDTTLYTKYYNQVANRAYTYQFAYHYVDQHRKELEKYKTWQSLEQHLIKANWLPQFVDFCQKKGIAPVDKDIAVSRPLIERIVNAYIVRNMLGEEGFFPLFERDDEITKRAIQYLSTGK
ncbi:MAG: S41 family peptidase [Paludibacteraceae bacterium]|nr:S41 family peptidase [Paludibacteraceae bacterium]